MQQSSSREMEGGGMNSLISPHSHSQVSLENGHSQSQEQFHESQNSQHDDFLEQMLSTIPNCSWPPHDLPSSNPNAALKPGDSPSEDPDPSAAAFHYHHPKSLLLQQHEQLLLSRAALRSPSDPGILPLPLSLGTGDSVDPSPFKSPSVQAADASVQALYDGFAGSLPNQQHFHPPPPQGASLPGGHNFGGQAVMKQAPPASASTGGSSGAAPQRQRVRARRGQATDPHSIAERLRRERIAERMKALQELVPNANKTDKASMLDEIIDYVKFLQLQVKVLSMSRLGGAAAVAPLVADMSSEGGGGVGRSSNGNQTGTANDSMTVTEHQVAKLMEEDMGSAMQYLQGKGLCLMPISLATAISTATSLSRNPLPPSRTHNHDMPSSNVEAATPATPNMSGLMPNPNPNPNPTADNDAANP